MAGIVAWVGASGIGPHRPSLVASLRASRWSSLGAPVMAPVMTPVLAAIIATVIAAVVAPIAPRINPVIISINIMAAATTIIASAAPTVLNNLPQSEATLRSLKRRLARFLVVIIHHGRPFSGVGAFLRVSS